MLHRHAEPKLASTSPPSPYRASPGTLRFAFGYAWRSHGVKRTRHSPKGDDGGATAFVFWYGAIAQLGERVLCKHEVVGSIPSGSTSLRWLCQLRLGKPLLERAKTG